MTGGIKGKAVRRRTAQALAPHLTAAGWGRIINTGGLAARGAGH